MSSFYINKVGALKWRVLETIYIDGKKTTKFVPKEAYFALGINPDWTIEEAKVRISQLNKTNRIEKKKLTASVRRLKEERLIESAFLVEDQVKRFIEYLKKVKRTRVQSKKFLSYWNFTQKLIAELKTEPQYYRDVQDQIYMHFVDKQISPSYSKKILAVLNMWGRFVSREQKAFFEPVEGARGADLNAIRKAYQKKESYRGPSKPLTPELLESIKDKLPSIDQYNWCFVSVWFGLRPEEIDSLSNKQSWRIELDPKTKAKNFCVYQTKLESSVEDEEDRWKSIPVIFPEQNQALKIIEDGNLVAPLNKVLKKHTEGCTKYGGRKNFVDLMLDRGQDFQEISLWMGHKDIKITFDRYKLKNRVRFKKPA